MVSGDRSAPPGHETAELSRRAIARLRQVCEEELAGRYEMRVVDVLEQPQLAEDERILATPTVVKELPPPLARVIGDLSDTGKLLLGLNIALVDDDEDEEGGIHHG